MVGLLGRLDPSPNGPQTGGNQARKTPPGLARDLAEKLWGPAIFGGVFSEIVLAYYHHKSSKIIPKSQNHPKIITKSSQNHHKIFTNHPKIITKSSQNHPKIITNHAKIITKSSQNHPKIITNHPKIIPKSSMNPWSGKSRSWIRNPFFHDSSVLIFASLWPQHPQLEWLTLSEDWPCNGNHLAVVNFREMKIPGPRRCNRVTVKKQLEMQKCTVFLFEGQSLISDWQHDWFQAAWLLKLETVSVQNLSEAAKGRWLASQNHIK